MEFMVLRRANQSTERGQQPPALEPGTFLRPSAEALRLLRRDGVWSQAGGPFPPRELVAGFTLIEAASKEDAIEQVRWWPLFDSGAVYEIRDIAGPAGGAGFDERGTAAGNVPSRDTALTRYVVFIRSDAGAEADLEASPDAIAALDARNEAAVREGVLLAAEALRASVGGARVHYANSRTTVVEGPFTEPGELVAGYLMLQAPTREAAVAWALSYPYPQAGDLTLELREACERVAHQEFTPEMRAAEARLRAELLEAGLRKGGKA